MASKNHRRYKIRKENSKKHYREPLFTEPPVLIHDWEGLVGMRNDKYYLDISLDERNGWVRSNTDNIDPDSFYLSTHTFYGNMYNYSTMRLRMYGFNVQLENCDGETVPCPYN